MYGNAPWYVRSVYSGGSPNRYVDDLGNGSNSLRSGTGWQPISNDGRADNMGMFSCVCCGTLLRLPPNSPCFRCTICATVNDMVPHPPLVSSVKPIGVYQVKYFVDQYFSGVLTVDQLIDSVIKPIFSSAASLNMSFKDVVNVGQALTDLELSAAARNGLMNPSSDLDTAQRTGAHGSPHQGDSNDNLLASLPLEQVSDPDYQAPVGQALPSVDLLQLGSSLSTMQPTEPSAPVLCANEPPEEHRSLLPVAEYDIGAESITTVASTLRRSTAEDPDIHTQDTVELPLPHDNVSLVFALLSRVAAESAENAEKIATAYIDSALVVLSRPGFLFKQPRDIVFLQYLLELPIAKVNGKDLEEKQRALQSKLYGFLGNVSSPLQSYLVHCFAQQQSTSALQKKLDASHRFLSHLLTRSVSDRVVRLQSYGQQWEIRCTARFMALLYAGNQMRPSHAFVEKSHSRQVNFELEKLPTYSFYNTVVDYVDLLDDFQGWSGNPAFFSFCQYPFLMSLGSKLRILEQETQAAMMLKQRAAVLQTLFQGQFSDPMLSISVRRSRLIADSVNALSQPNLDFGKKLRVSFIDEEGVDAGGLTKEWFLLLTRQLFDPSYAIFDVDQESQQCWFSKQFIEGDTEFIANFYLVGLIVALAIYNGNNLDLGLPLAAYKLLCGLLPSIEDYVVLHPLKGKQFVKMLEFDGSAAEFDATYYGVDFVAEYDCFGQTVRQNLVPNGDNICVTLDNRQEYVDRYVEWYFCDSCKVQYDSFRQGFQRVLTGKAVPLFCPEELELLVRGSPELDLSGLQQIATFENCNRDDVIVKWLFEVIDEFSEADKRRFLSFVTGTDRVPATGIENMTFKVSLIRGVSDHESELRQGAAARSFTYAGAPNSGQARAIVDRDLPNYLPVAHTCFNQLCLYNYTSKTQLCDKLYKAINYSSEFGLR